MVTATEVGIEHVGKYMRLSLGWPTEGGFRETVVTAMVDGVHYTTEYAPERPVAVVVSLDLGSEVIDFLLPDGPEKDISIGDTMDDLHPPAAGGNSGH